MVWSCRIRLIPRETGGNKGVAGPIGNIVLSPCCRYPKNGRNLRQHCVVPLLPTPTTTPGVPYRTPVLSGQQLAVVKSGGVRT
jgi:hypothetical protein